MERRLVAILAADVVGYSRHLADDEEGTIRSMRALHAAASSVVAAENGRIIDTAGDSILSEFPSVVAAVRCATALQDATTATGLELRIGIHQGEIAIDGDRVFGDGINIASRLQAMAEPGGIVISGRVHEDVATKLQLKWRSEGERSFKNIPLAFRVYHSITAADLAISYPALPDRPSIAALPFQNMSGDPEQEYFADGMVEEIITALSRFSGLLVIARNSSFTYKGRAIDVKQVGRELGVRYVLEGSVRKAGSRVRITVQLVDASTGAHLWANRFDGYLADVFELQDQVSTSVVGAIAPKLERAEIDRSRRKPTGSLDAYDYYLRGLAALHLWTKEGNDKAISHLYKAIELDPDFATAYGMAAHCYEMRPTFGWVKDITYEEFEMTRLARQAADLGKDDPIALSTAAASLALYTVTDTAIGAALIGRALALNPNMAFGWLVSGWVKVHRGEFDAAIEDEGRAIRLSPFDPYIFDMQAAIAYAHYFAGRYSEVVRWAELSVQGRPNYVTALRILAIGYAMIGQADRAQKAMDRCRELKPSFRLSDANVYFTPDLAAIWADGLRKAGVLD